MCRKWDYEKESKADMSETKKRTVGEEAPSLGQTWRSMAPLLHALPKIFIFLFLTLHLLHNIIINLYFYLFFGFGFLWVFFFDTYICFYFCLMHYLKEENGQRLNGSKESAAPGIVGS